MNDNDYKHVISDYSTTSIGVRLSFGEIMNIDRVPYKFQSIVQSYILNGLADEDTLLLDYIMNPEPDKNTYRIFKRLKTKVSFYSEKKDGSYKMKTLKYDDFLKCIKEKWDDNNFIQEITFSNLALMTFMV